MSHPHKNMKDSGLELTPVVSMDCGSFCPGLENSEVVPT